MTNIKNNTNSNTTITEQQEHKEQHNHNYERSDYYDYNYNNYNNTHGTRRVLPPEAGERIREAYIDNVSDRMTGAAAKIIEDAYQAGMSIEQIIMAIEDTGLAPRPSPAYLRAILVEWTQCGITVSRSTREVTQCKAKPWWK